MLKVSQEFAKATAAAGGFMAVHLLKMLIEKGCSLRSAISGVYRDTAMARRPGLPGYLQEGFILPYNRSDAARFHVLAAITAATFAAWLTWGYQLLSITAILAGCSAYYFFPFTESRPRLGANEYGLFIDGFGLVAWRAIGEVNLVTYSVRTLEMEELHVKLIQPVNGALLADWRRLPIWRLLMRLPWNMGCDNTVRINLQPFAPPAKEIHRRVFRMWRYYR